MLERELFVGCVLTATTLVIVAVAQRVPRRGVVTIALVGLLLRLITGLAQTHLALFTENADSLVYAYRGRAIAELGFDRSFVPDLLPLNQRGIVGVHALVGELAGSVPLGPTVALLGACASSVAVALMLLNIDRLSIDGAPLEERSYKRCAWTLALLPSFVFWGSLNLKEPFLMLGLALVVNGLAVPRRRGWSVLAGLGVTFAFRPYIGVLALAAVALVLFGRPLLRSRALLAAAVCVGFYGAVTLGQRFVGVSLTQQRAYSVDAGGGSSVSAVSATSPEAIVQTVFAPLPWMVPSSGVGLLSHLEGLVVGVAILVAVVAVARGRVDLSTPARLFVVILPALVLVIYGLALANAGTVVRERSPAVLVAAPLLVQVLSRAPRTGSPHASQSAEQSHLPPGQGGERAEPVHGRVRDHRRLRLR